MCGKRVVRMMEDRLRGPGSPQVSADDWLSIQGEMLADLPSGWRRLAGGRCGEERCGGGQCTVGTPDYVWFSRKSRSRVSLSVRWSRHSGSRVEEEAVKQREKLSPTATLEAGFGL
jgi:hypothetical protein